MLVFLKDLIVLSEDNYRSIHELLHSLTIIISDTMHDSSITHTHPNLVAASSIRVKLLRLSLEHNDRLGINTNIVSSLFSEIVNKFTTIRYRELEEKIIPEILKYQEQLTELFLNAPSLPAEELINFNSKIKALRIATPAMNSPETNPNHTMALEIINYLTNVGQVNAYCLSNAIKLAQRIYNEDDTTYSHLPCWYQNRSEVLNLTTTMPEDSTDGAILTTVNMERYALMQSYLDYTHALITKIKPLVGSKTENNIATLNHCSIELTKLATATITDIESFLEFNEFRNTVLSDIIAFIAEANCDHHFTIALTDIIKLLQERDLEDHGLLASSTDFSLDVAKTHTLIYTQIKNEMVNIDTISANQRTVAFTQEEIHTKVTSIQKPIGISPPTLIDLLQLIADSFDTLSVLPHSNSQHRLAFINKRNEVCTAMLLQIKATVLGDLSNTLENIVEYVQDFEIWGLALSSLPETQISSNMQFHLNCYAFLVDEIHLVINRLHLELAQPPLPKQPLLELMNFIITFGDSNSTATTVANNCSARLTEIADHSLTAIAITTALDDERRSLQSSFFKTLAGNYAITHSIYTNINFKPIAEALDPFNENHDELFSFWNTSIYNDIEDPRIKEAFDRFLSQRQLPEIAAEFLASKLFASNNFLTELYGILVKNMEDISDIDDMAEDISDMLDDTIENMVEILHVVCSILEGGEVRDNAIHFLIEKNCFHLACIAVTYLDYCATPINYKSPDYYNLSPLLRLISGNDLEIHQRGELAKILVEQGANLFDTDASNNTALLLALKRNEPLYRELIPFTTKTKSFTTANSTGETVISKVSGGGTSLSLYEMTRDSLARCQKKTSYASSPQHSRCSFTTNPFAILDMDEESLPATERTRQQQQRIT